MAALVPATAIAITNLATGVLITTAKAVIVIVLVIGTHITSGYSAVVLVEIIWFNLVLGPKRAVGTKSVLVPGSKLVLVGVNLPVILRMARIAIVTGITAIADYRLAYSASVLRVICAVTVVVQVRTRFVDDHFIALIKIIIAIVRRRNPGECGCLKIFNIGLKVLEWNLCSEESYKI